jgi:methionyl-tRNA formyltransferase
MAGTTQKKVTVWYFGNPDFAVEPLRFLACWDLVQVTGVVTSPPRRKGRGRSLSPTPVGLFARKENLPTWEVEKIADLKPFTTSPPDLIVLCAFGKILPPWLLSVPRLLPMNIHPSLLPRHRGPDPIRFTILKGDSFTGVTLIRMTPQCDEGPILLSRSIPVDPRETYGTLLEKLKPLMVEILRDGIVGILSGTIRETPQDGKEASYTKKFSSEPWLSFDLPAEVLDRWVRAFSPEPGVWSGISGKPIKVLFTEYRKVNSSYPPGTTVGEENGLLWVQCKEGQLGIKVVHPPGKKRIFMKEYLLGHRIPPGTVWDPPPPHRPVTTLL